MFFCFFHLNGTSCRFWPQVAFAWMVAWLARLKTDGKRPVDELNLKSLAGLGQSSYQLTIRLDSSQAGEEKDSSCHDGPSWQAAGLHWLWVSRPSGSTGNQSCGPPGESGACPSAHGGPQVGEPLQPLTVCVHLYKDKTGKQYLSDFLYSQF